MTETFYDVLGVSADATAEEIETAYRDAIKEAHPDVSDDADASRRTKRLNKAKRVLTDADERARYDRIGHDAYVDGGPGSAADGAAGSGGSGDEDSAASESAGSAAAGGTNDGPTWRGGSTGNRRRSAGRRRRSTDRNGSSNGRWSSNRSWARDERQSASRRESSEDRAADRDRVRDRTRPGDATSGRTDASASDAVDGTATSGATRSRTDSTGPAWQSGQGGTATSRSARRQAAASGPDGPNVDWSWNSWDPRDAWAVRRSDGRDFRASRLFPTDQSVVLLASTFVCYPFFVGSLFFPPFPLAVRAVVGVCTILTFAYLLSMPEVAILVYGSWAVVATLALLVVPGIGLFSLVGVVALTATWIPLGISVLTLSILRP